MECLDAVGIITIRFIMRIAIIHYHWFLQIHGKQIINALAKKGIHIDAYFIDMIDMYETLEFHKNVTVYKRKIDSASWRILSTFFHSIYRRLPFSRKIISFFFDMILLGRVCKPLIEAR